MLKRSEINYQTDGAQMESSALSKSSSPQFRLCPVNIVANDHTVMSDESSLKIFNRRQSSLDSENSRDVFDQPDIESDKGDVTSRPESSASTSNGSAPRPRSRDEFGEDGAPLLNVHIPTQTKKAQKRKHIRTSFDDETLDQSAQEAQRREKERLERLEKSRQNNASDHISQMQALFQNTNPLPQLTLDSSDFEPELFGYQNGQPLPTNYDNDIIELKHMGGGFPGPSNANSSASKAPPEIIDLSSDEEEEFPRRIVPRITYSSNNSIASGYGRRNRWATAEKDRADNEQMEAQYKKEQARIQRMRQFHNIESTETTTSGRLLVNSGHPSEEPDFYVAPHLTHVLQPHQLGGVRFMFDNIVESLEEYRSSPGFGCILAHSMGLGKTIQVITFTDVFLRATQAKKVLIIVPINTIQNWNAEFDKWMPRFSTSGEAIRSFEVFLFGDSVKSFDQRVNLIEQWETKGGVLLIGYDMFRLLIRNTQPKKKKDRIKLNMNGVSNGGKEADDFIEEAEVGYTPSGRVKQEAHQLIRQALLDPGPNLVICDEGHKIKNLNTDIATSLSSIKSRRRVVLTGYPLQNNLMEYYCMVDFVRPKYLGEKKTFADRFERPIKNGQCVDSTPNDIKLARQRTHVLVEMLKGFVQRRTHILLKSILPPSKEYVVLLRKSNIQRLLYRSFVLYAKAELSAGNTGNVFNPLKAFAACSRIWNHPDILKSMLDRRKEERNKRNEQMNQQSNVDQQQQQPQNVYPNNQFGNGGGFNQPYQNMPLFGFPNQFGQQNPTGFNGFNGHWGSSPGSSGQYYGAGKNGSEDPFAAGTPTKSKRKTGKTTTGRLTLASALVDDADADDQTLKYDWAEQSMMHYQKGDVENGYKLAIALGIVDECVRIGDKMLIFSQNLTVLSILEEYLERRPLTNVNGNQERWVKNRNYFRFDGSTNGSEREKLINRFNSDNSVYLFLISTRAGSLGINLVSANRCIIFDACWNPCHDAQAVCRVYRYGQQRRTFIYRLIMDNSMERAIFNRQVSKQGLQQRVVDDAQVDTNITQNELETLLVYDEHLDVVHDKWNTSEWELEDEVLKKVAARYSHMFAQEPFLHESMMMEREEGLSEEEKKEAQLLFEKERRMESSSIFESSSNNSILDAASRRANSSFGAPNNFNFNPFDFFNNPPPMKATPIPGTLHMLPPDFANYGGATMMNAQNPNGGMNMMKDPSSFPGAEFSLPATINESGTVQAITTDRPFMLPLVGRGGRQHALPQGSQVTLVKPSRGGVYLQLDESTILDASGSIFDQSYVVPPQRRMLPPKPFASDEIIELD
ncbi:unnamed protein product [Caenorhabditis auriculariae]|uniref:Uncharacterized protein n=1 Tax=Caenorhabditis auriculariae TaxID=2777116 RepID=A0A8S1H831_9PELO|nr:unnamed protein product [Caenorhabditis auriculariae]